MASAIDVFVPEWMWSIFEDAAKYSDETVDVMVERHIGKPVRVFRNGERVGESNDPRT